MAPVGPQRHRKKKRLKNLLSTLYFVLRHYHLLRLHSFHNELQITVP